MVPVFLFLTSSPTKFLWTKLLVLPQKFYHLQVTDT